MRSPEFAEFLVRAKKETYAGGGEEVSPQRPGFKELEYKEGDWYYRDSYSGFYQAPGQEVVYFQGKPVWAMAYSGGMKKEFHGDEALAKKTFGFLQKCLSQVEVFRRGKDFLSRKRSFPPTLHRRNDYSEITSNLVELKHEEVTFRNLEKSLWRQRIIGRSEVRIKSCRSVHGCQ